MSFVICLKSYFVLPVDPDTSVLSFSWFNILTETKIFEESWKERKWVYPPVVGQNGYLGSATSFALAGQQSTFNPMTDDESNLVAFPDVDLYRQGLFEYWWLGRFSNGSYITPGKYK